MNEQAKSVTITNRRLCRLLGIRNGSLPVGSWVQVSVRKPPEGKLVYTRDRIGTLGAYSRHGDLYSSRVSFDNQGIVEWWDDTAPDFGKPRMMTVTTGEHAGKIGLVVDEDPSRYHLAWFPGLSNIVAWVAKSACLLLQLPDPVLADIVLAEMGEDAWEQEGLRPGSRDTWYYIDVFGNIGRESHAAFPFGAVPFPNHGAAQSVRDLIFELGLAWWPAETEKGKV